MKKVCIFLDYYGCGGIEKIINDIYYNLNNKYEFDVLSFSSSDSNVISLLDKEYKSFFKRNIFGMLKLKKYFRNNFYDIIHINCYNSFGYLYAFFLKKYCRKIIIQGHNSNVDNDKFKIKKIINYIVRDIFKSNYITITPTEEVNKFCFKNENNILLTNGICYNNYYFNNEHRIYYRNLFNIKEHEKVIGMIGRFEKQKNYEFIIEVFKKIFIINNNYKLVLIGTGSLFDKIKNKASGFKNIIFLSNRKDLNKLINMFDIYVQPSLYEGFGLSVVENEVNGKYVFVSNNISNYVKISNRIKFLPLDKILWVKEIIELKENNLELNDNLELVKFIEEIDKIYRK